MSKKIRAGSSDPAVQKIIKAEKRIEECPFDIEAWNVLIRDAQGRKIEEARPFFERLVVQVLGWAGGRRAIKKFGRSRL